MDGSKCAAGTDAAHVSHDDRCVGRNCSLAELSPSSHARWHARRLHRKRWHADFCPPAQWTRPDNDLHVSVPLNWVCVSPDGRWVAFLDGFQLKKVALTGGPAETIAVGVVLAGATWAPDDTIIFGDNRDLATGLQRVSASGGEVAVLTRPDEARGDRDHLWPEMLPGGRAVLFTITATTGGTDAAQVAVLDLATGKQTVVVREGATRTTCRAGTSSTRRVERCARFRSILPGWRHGARR